MTHEWAHMVPAIWNKEYVKEKEELVCTYLFLDYLAQLIYSYQEQWFISKLKVIPPAHRKVWGLDHDSNTTFCMVYFFISMVSV